MSSKHSTYYTYGAEIHINVLVTKNGPIKQNTHNDVYGVGMYVKGSGYSVETIQSVKEIYKTCPSYGMTGCATCHQQSSNPHTVHSVYRQNPVPACVVPRSRGRKFLANYVSQI